MPSNNTDSLTGLIDRSGAVSMLNELLDHAVEPVTVLLCDVRGVRSINGAHGQEAGDAVLRLVADRLKAATETGDIVARLGGTEFLIISPRPLTSEQAGARADALLQALAPDFTIADGPVAIGATIGIALAAPSATANSLLQDADAAMHTARQLRLAHVLFDNAAHAEVHAHQSLAGDLRRATRTGQIDVAFQPLLDTASGRIVGTETLLRWHHPDLGDVGPDVCVGLAEQMGLIGEIGSLVLHRALTQQSRWQATLGDQAPDWVAVNVSAHQLNDPNFVDDVQKALADAGLPASALTLEVTETVLMADLDASAVTLAALADLGITLDIDDFGTGFSSLAYLTRLPVHAAKVDKSFVSGIGADPRLTTTLETMLTLAASLGLRRIAEGVETADHLAWLRAHGCELVQGYYVSPPLTADELSDLLVSGRRW